MTETPSSRTPSGPLPVPEGNRGFLSGLRPHERRAVLFLLQHGLAGAVGAIVLGTGLLALDVAGLGTLVSNSSQGILAAAMIYFGLFITFGSVAMGIGIMSQSDGVWPPRGGESETREGSTSAADRSDAS